MNRFTQYETITRTPEEAVTALSAGCLPCELAAAAAEAETPDFEETAKWEGILTYEGVMTGDGRIIQNNALRWENLPIPLRWSSEDNGGHAGAVVVGRISDIQRRDDGAIYAIGDFDLGSEAGREAARQVQEGLTPGVSVDLDDVAFEVRVASDAVDEFKGVEAELSADDVDEEGRVKVSAGRSDDELMITTDGRIRAATLVAIPAFESARISLAAASTIDEHGRWHSPVHGRYIDMPDVIIDDLLDRLDAVDSRGQIPSNLAPITTAAKKMSDAIRNQDIDALGEAEKEFLTVTHLPDIGDDFRTDPDLMEALDAVAAVLDRGSFGDEGDFPAGQNPNVTYPPNPIMEDFLIEKGYERDVVDGLTDEELRADFENEGGLDTSLNDELDAEEAGARAAEDPNRQPKSVGDMMPDVIKQIDEANPTPSEMSDAELVKAIHEINVVPREITDEAKRRGIDLDAARDGKLKKVDGKLVSSSESFNWVDDVGGLPQYIKRIAKHLKEKGMAEGRAIATAVNVSKKMCATGDLNFPGAQQVNPGSRAEACAAVADWERKKAQANADAADPDEFRDVSTAERDRLTEEGKALDGSYPIENCNDLENAIQAIGRAKDPAAVRAFIKKRAGELDCNVELPESITAGAFPLQPPAEWFANPNLDGPTPLKVTPEGRVYGHLAVWGTCHTAYPGQCVTPPSSHSNYAYFRTGSVFANDGSEHPTGVITMDTLHAGKNLSAVSTLAHYENTGRAVADVTAGEDSYGIWISGALRPGVTEEQARVLRGSPLSGDWRKIGSGGLELVAALAVNVPGFPIPRPSGLVAGGSMVALVASGMLAPELSTRKARRVQRKALSEEDYAYLKRLADRERKMAEQEVAQMALEVEVTDLANSIGI